MSIENPGIDKDIVPNQGGDNTKFDAMGKPRTMHTLPDGTMAMLSDAEYTEELQSREAHTSQE